MRIILCGFGVVGQSLVKLLESRSHDLYTKYGIKPKVVGISDSSGYIINKNGIDLFKTLIYKKKFGKITKHDDHKHKCTTDLIDKCRIRYSY